jgi:hypothetical protein
MGTALPEFFLIGAMKAGTTSLYRYLAQHPQLFMPTLKEPNFYALVDVPADDLPERTRRQSSLLRSDYQHLFRRSAPDQRVGEGSIRYLTTARAAAHIAADRPDARFIAVLRDPAERSWSHFVANRDVGVEPIADFQQALDAEKERRGRGIHHQQLAYQWLGLYDQHLRAFDSLFPRDQFCFLLYEDFSTEPAAAVRRVFEFLGVDPDFAPDMTIRHHVTGEARTPALAWLLGHRESRERLKRWLPVGLTAQLGRTLRNPRPSLDPLLRERLVDACRADIERLQARLDRDLSAWLA